MEVVRGRESNSIATHVFLLDWNILVGFLLRMMECILTVFKLCNSNFINNLVDGSQMESLSGMH